MNLNDGASFMIKVFANVMLIGITALLQFGMLFLTYGIVSLELVIVLNEIVFLGLSFMIWLSSNGSKSFLRANNEVVVYTMRLNVMFILSCLAYYALNIMGYKYEWIPPVFVIGFILLSMFFGMQSNSKQG